jgi:hypothetical protein
MAKDLYGSVIKGIIQFHAILGRRFLMALTARSLRWSAKASGAT